MEHSIELTKPCCVFVFVAATDASQPNGVAANAASSSQLGETTPPAGNPTSANIAQNANPEPLAAG